MYIHTYIYWIPNQLIHRPLYSRNIAKSLYFIIQSILYMLYELYRTSKSELGVDLFSRRFSSRGTYRIFTTRSTFGKVLVLPGGLFSLNFGTLMFLFIQLAFVGRKVDLLMRRRWNRTKTERQYDLWRHMLMDFCFCELCYRLFVDFVILHT